MKNINSLKSDTPSKWEEVAGFMIENEAWLNYSQEIAAIVPDKLNTRQNLTQKSLAEKLDVNPQYITKLLKGQENLTLKTISRLEKALGIRLIHVGSLPRLEKETSNQCVSPWIQANMESSCIEPAYSSMSV